MDSYSTPSLHAATLFTDAFSRCPSSRSLPLIRRCKDLDAGCSAWGAEGQCESKCALTLTACDPLMRGSHHIACSVFLHARSHAHSHARSLSQSRCRLRQSKVHAEHLPSDVSPVRPQRDAVQRHALHWCALSSLSLTSRFSFPLIHILPLSSAASPLTVLTFTPRVTPRHMSPHTPRVIGRRDEQPASARRLAEGHGCEDAETAEVCAPSTVFHRPLTHAFPPITSSLTVISSLTPHTALSTALSGVRASCRRGRVQREPRVDASQVRGLVRAVQAGVSGSSGQVLRLGDARRLR